MTKLLFVVLYLSSVTHLMSFKNGQQICLFDDDAGTNILSQFVLQSHDLRHGEPEPSCEGA
jgi:hypothetical protein